MKRQLVIIGGGPAGLSAAIEAYLLGVKDVLLIEREHELGGILNQCIHSGFGIHEFGEELTGPEYASRLVEALKETAVEVWSSSSVIEIAPHKELIILRQGSRISVEAEAVILATGCRERTPGAISLLGERPAGMYLAGAAQKMINLEGLSLGTKALIYGSGDIGLIMARRLTLEGVEVQGVVEISAVSSGLERNITQCLQDFDIPLYLNTRIKQVLGRDHLTGVLIENLVTNEVEEIACDLLLLSVGLIPEIDLVQSYLALDEKGKLLVDERRETQVDGFFACGNALHVHDIVDDVSEEARIAARGAKDYLEGRRRASQHRILAGEKVLTHIPQRYGSSSVEIYLRSTETLKGARVQLKREEEILFEKKVPLLIPSQLFHLKLPKELHLSGDITLEIVP